jgi:hypothetical protein
MAFVNPPLVSEREAGIDEDCVPCSALMGVLAHHPGLAPASHDEAQRLRAAAGYGTEGGTSVEGIARGVIKRYNLFPKIVTSFAALWSALSPGHGAYVVIKPSAMPWGHPLRQYMGSFTGLHCIYVGRKGYRRRVRAFDPEAPYGIGYTGFWLSKSDLERAFVGSAGVFVLHKA